MPLSIPSSFPFPLPTAYRPPPTCFILSAHREATTAAAASIERVLESAEDPEVSPALPFIRL